MNAEFIPLADILRPRAYCCGAAEESRDVSSVSGACNSAEPLADAFPHTQSVAHLESIAAVATDAHKADGNACAPDDGLAQTLRELRLFRARVLDAFDDAAARMLRELGSDVLARELRLAPCDLAAIVARIRMRVPALRVRVASVDVPAFADIPVVADAALAPGDAVVEVAGGALDARLGVRLAAVLDAFA